MPSLRERREAQLQARVEKALAASFDASPLGQVAPGGVQTSAAMTPAQLQALAGTFGPAQPAMARALGRSNGSFSGGMGPAYPIDFMPLDAVNANGRPDPRKYQYPIAWNLNLEEHLAQWEILAAAAVQIDLFSRAIAIRSGDVTKMDWAFQVTDDAINTIVDANNCSTSEAAKIARTQFMPDIIRASEMWENPYPQSDKGWPEWITEGLWQVLTYDGWAIHPAMNLAGKVIGFEHIDASTIKCLLDNEGGTPRPPDVAFQQILYGFPRGEFVASPNKDVLDYLGGEFGVTQRDQLSYYVMNKRTRSPYGLSPVEQGLAIANVYVERLKWLTYDYQYGSTARGYIESDISEISSSNIQDYNRVINSWFQGSSANRQTLLTLPNGMKAPIFAPEIGEKFKADYDEMWIKRIAAHFGVQPSQFGVVARAGLGGGKGAAEGEQDQAETISSKPQNKYLEGVVNSLSRRHLNLPKAIAFNLIDDEGSEDELEKANALAKYYSFGALTANEVREELGKSRYTFPEADMPLIITATGAVALEGIVIDPATGERNTPIQGDPNALNSSAVSGSGNQDQPQDQDKPDEGEEPSRGTETSGGEGETSQTDVETTKKSLRAAEARAFRKFMRNGSDRILTKNGWSEREFEFKYHSLSEIDVLKAGLAPRPKSLLKRKKEELHNFVHVVRIAKEHKAAIAAGLAATGIMHAISQALDGESVATAVQSVTFSTSALTSALNALYASASSSGASEAGVEAITNGPLMSQVLDNAGITIAGIEGTARDHLTTMLAEGINNGDAAGTIANTIQEAFGAMSDRQALMIAETEANRAYCAAYADSSFAAGVTELNWVAYDSACPVCLDNESNSPYSLGELPDMPAHPACMCSWESVT